MSQFYRPKIYLTYFRKKYIFNLLFYIIYGYVLKYEYYFFEKKYEYYLFVPSCKNIWNFIFLSKEKVKGRV